ncbi:MAG: S-layer homology domain-containing protein [Clostridiales bacterium]|jgi:hypothetical protein|nr:S-layer homology domain-containing protein [Clostridiales bacterium]
MKKFIGILVGFSILIGALPVMAAGGSAIISANKSAVNTGEIVEATFRVKDIKAMVITLPVHFNPNVVKVADKNGDAIISGVKTLFELETGDVGVIRGQAVDYSEDAYDSDGNPKYWNGGILDNPQYPSLNNEKGLYKLLFTNIADRAIVDETLVTIRFVAVGAGNADIRFATSADEAYDATAPTGLRYDQSEQDAPGFLVASAANVTVTGESKTPGTSSGGGGGGGKLPTVDVEPPAMGEALTYEVPAKLVENALARAEAETDNVLRIKVNSDEIVNKFIIKMPISAVIRAYSSYVFETEFVTNSGTIGFSNEEVSKKAKAGSKFVICTLSADERSVTIDGVPLDQIAVENPPAGSQFSDVPSGYWAHEYITSLVNKSILNGVGDNKFEPESNVTREQFAKMLVGALGILDANATCDFTDVGAADWHYQYVASAAKTGIISGYTDGTFGTGQNITRQEMAAMISRAKPELPQTEGEIIFLDSNEIADWAKADVTKAQRAGIIAGFPDGTFAPLDNATRAQAAKIIYAMLEI